MPTIIRTSLYAAICLPCVVQAHHSIVVHYDPEDVRAINGTLESLIWRNPHTIWVFSVEDEQGERTTWRAEGGSVNTLERNGLSREMFPVGQALTVIGPVARSGRNLMVAVQTVVDGNEYGIFPALSDELSEELPPETQPTFTSAAGYVISYAPATDLFRVWTPVDFPATGVRPLPLPLTDSAQASLDAYDPASGDLAAQCVPAGMPSMLDQPYPIEFIDEGDRITMRVEEWNGVRTIYMTDDGGDEGLGTIYGRSTGRLDGNTLTIETTGISYPYYNDAGVPLTEDAVVTERYSLREDGRRMDWSVTTVDPSVFTDPTSLSGWYVWAPDIEIKEFQCVE